MFISPIGVSVVAVVWGSSILHCNGINGFRCGFDSSLRILFHCGPVDFAVLVMVFTEGVKLYLVILPVLESQADFTGIVDTLADYLPLAIVIEEEWAEHIELVPTLSRHAGYLRTEHRRSTLTFQSRSCKMILPSIMPAPRVSRPRSWRFLLGAV